MARKVWIEVAMNGGWSRKLQPNIPVSVDELIADAVACIRAGAAILHLHALDPATGQQNDDPGIYAAAIQGIKAEVDAIVYPTLPIGLPEGWRGRYDAVERLGEQGLLEWAVVDPGSLNLGFRDPASGRMAQAAITYVNTDADVRHGMELGARYGFHPDYALFEPGFIRMGAAMQRMHPKTPAPIYSLRFGDRLSFGMPPEEWALDSMLRLLRSEMPEAIWFTAVMGGDVLPLVPAVVARGGHVRTGLEDAAMGCPDTNPELVRRVAEAIRNAGGEPATAGEVRATLNRTEAAMPVSA